MPRRPSSPATARSSSTRRGSRAAAFAEGPFAGVDDLHAALVAAMREAPRERQLALIRAHPELAGREAQAGELTAASAGEQALGGPAIG